MTGIPRVMTNQVLTKRDDLQQTHGEFYSIRGDLQYLPTSFSNE